MRRPSFITKSGPYRVMSISNGEIVIRPDWPQMPPWTPVDGGGPGVFSRVGLAYEIERWLNNGRTYEEIKGEEE